MIDEAYRRGEAARFTLTQGLGVDFFFYREKTTENSGKKEYDYGNHRH